MRVEALLPCTTRDGLWRAWPMLIGSSSCPLRTHNLDPHNIGSVQIVAATFYALLRLHIRSPRQPWFYVAVAAAEKCTLKGLHAVSLARRSA